MSTKEVVFVEGVDLELSEEQTLLLGELSVGMSRYKESTKSRRDALEGVVNMLDAWADQRASTTQKDKSQYQTEPLFRDGCHPVIADHLSRGQAVVCKVWDKAKSVARERTTVRTIVRHYQYKDGEYYYMTSDGAPYENAEPLLAKTKRVMPAEKAIPLLMSKGWKFDEEGHLRSPTCYTIHYLNYHWFGQEIQKGTPSIFKINDLIEEVED